MQWPHAFLVVLLGIQVVAFYANYLIPQGRRGFVIGLTLNLAATGCWLAYETYLFVLNRTGGPLLRIDLFLVIPMLIIAWHEFRAKYGSRSRTPRTSKDGAVEPPK